MASQSPHHPDPSSAAFVPEKSPEEQRSSHAAADAARAMEHTNSWKPSFERRQSWNKEDQKRELQMSQIKDTVQTGPGFTERA